jgi:hypothetical protein
MKYEIFQVRLPKGANMFVEVGVMHHDHLVHAMMAEALVPCVAANFSTPVENVKVVSAGFCSEGFPFTCWGNSDSLNLSSRGDTDSMILAKTMLNFENVHITGYDEIRTPMRNIAQNCSVSLELLRNQTYLLVNDISCPSFTNHTLHVVEAPARLQYLGPSINAKNKPVQLFREVKDYGVMYDNILALTEQQMESVFVENKIVSQIARAGAVVMVVDDIVGTYIVERMIDPYPLSDFHDEIEVTVVHAQTKTPHVITGSLTELAAKLHLDSEG